MNLICHRSCTDVYFQPCVTRDFTFPQRIPLQRVTTHGKPLQRELLPSVRCRAFENGLLFLSTPPPPRDPSVLLVTSGVLLFVYWIANFVVPEFILGAAPTEDPNEERMEKEMDLLENDSSGTGNGFGSPRRTPNRSNGKKKSKL
ncbi:hypothetical protein H6P81_001882 [Aristolochia fimbriata]|uniref:Transmembrane protein n=1 Tax=Aristolochia fimbriata TaxID=158543 RepID=A0AAV7F9V4_ARIFI|nr:hypothetical protein H6P81_001882 [Aristolochia fimbriata]